MASANDEVCGEPHCLYDPAYDYHPIEIPITNHVRYLKERLNETAAAAMWSLVQQSSAVRTAAQVSMWLELYSHYREVIGHDPLPDGYTIRLSASGGDQ